MDQIQAFVTAHAAVFVLVWPLATALASVLYKLAENNPRMHAALSFLAGLGIDLPKLWDALGRMLTGAAASTAAKLLPLALVAGLGLASSGCLSSAPVVPVTPANQQQVSSCETTATTHNAFVLGDIVIGGVTTGLAGVSAAVTDNNTKTALAISAAVAAGLTAIGTGGVGLTTVNFEDSKCSDVVGSLPLASKAAQ